MKQSHWLLAIGSWILTMLTSVVCGYASEDRHALLATVTLGRPLYVQTGGETPVLMPAGVYTVARQDDQHLRLVRKGSEPVILKALPSQHDQEIDRPFAMAVDDPQNLDLTHVLLLSPDGRSLETTGSATGIFPREIPVHIFAAVAKNWATGSPVKEGLRIEPKTIRAGQDYDLLVLPYGICAVLCERDEQCQAFSWRPQSVKPTKGACHLKKSAPPKEADECCVSGVKESALPQGKKP